MAVTDTRKPLNKPFSEVVYSTNELIIAQCYKDSPSNKSDSKGISQGQVVKVISSYDASYSAFGLITKINNTSIDSIHKPSALGLSSNELKELQPQVYDLLRKEVEICLFAYTNEKEDIIKDPAPHPMTVHDFVYLPSNDELKVLTEDFSNLANIIKKHGLNPNLLVELITTGYILRNKNYDYLVKVGQELSITFCDEIHSLMLILKRLSQKK